MATEPQQFGCVDTAHKFIIEVEILLQHDGWHDSGGPLVWKRIKLTSTHKAIFSSAFARKQNEAVLKARAKQPPYKSSMLRELVRTAQRSVKLAE